MKRNLLLATALLMMTSACAILPFGSGKFDDSAILLTQVQPGPLAACIGQAFGTVPEPVQGGFSIQTSTPEALQLTVSRDDVQTVVRAPQDTVTPPEVSSAVIACGLKLAPLSSRS
jgi:hypothetical protein